MAAALDVFDSELREKVKSSRVLVIGAGGIGCELLKCIVLSGFRDIAIIDLDTIDVSNLNRQFLFQKQHVGKSKSKVARDSVQKLNPDAKITAHHGSVMSPDFGPDYFKQFHIVLNALDNRAARNHVNRICLAADIPLIESGTAGYLGQVTVIKKGETECYECEPKSAQKSYPGCTIRNTPSEPIHCIVWAKHLFNQLFGEDDPDEDVSPDTADPEASGDAGNKALENDANDAGNVKRVSTRTWAVSTGYDVDRIIHKLFYDDIKYLLSMDGLWQKRRPPTPLDVANLPDAVAGSSRSLVDISEMRDQRLWSVKECIDVLKTSVSSLKERLDALSLSQDGSTNGEGFLVWDKDDDPCMDFVTACANVRAHIFGITQKSRFDVKSMAGNIIPAIATTNAIIAGLIVMEALRILNGKFEDCRTVYLNKQPNSKGKLLFPSMLEKPNPKCAVCSAKPEVSVKLNTATFTVGNLESKILKGHLNMVAPDVTIEDGKGTIMISSEEGETEGNNSKFLSDFGIRSGTQLMCDDYVQIYKLVINIIDCNEESLRDGQDFEVVGDIDQLMAAQSENEKKSDNGESSNHKTNEDATNVEDDDDDDDDDLMVVEDMDVEQVQNIIVSDVPVVKKRPASGVGEGSSEDNVAKKAKHGGSDGDDVIVIM